MKFIHFFLGSLQIDSVPLRQFFFKTTRLSRKVEGMARRNLSNLFNQGAKSNSDSEIDKDGNS